MFLSTSQLNDLTCEFMNELGDLFRARSKPRTPISVAELVDGIDALLDDYESDDENHYSLLDLINFNRDERTQTHRLIYMYMVWRAFSVKGPSSTPLRVLAHISGCSYFEAYAVCQELEGTGLIVKNNTLGGYRQYTPIDDMYSITNYEEFEKCWEIVKPMTAEELSDKLDYYTYMLWKHQRRTIKRFTC